MKYIIFDKATGRIDSMREASGMNGAQIIENVFGQGAGEVFGAIPTALPAFPVGQMVKDGKLVTDPSYVPPAPAQA